MHDLMVFFSTLGGIAMFGPMGFIIGPMIAALFLSVLDIYSAEYRDHLDGTLPGTAPALPQLEPPEARREPVPDPRSGRVKLSASGMVFRNFLLPWRRKSR